MKRIYLILLVGLLLVQWSYGQVLFNLPQCIGAARRPVPQAQLELVATNQGLLLPRVLDTSAITAGGVTGLMIYATGDNRLYMYNGTRWTTACFCNNVAQPAGTQPPPVTGNPDARAVLDIMAVNQGLLLARVRDTNAITAGGVAGLLIYSASDNRYYVHNGRLWMLLGNCGTGETAGPTTKTGTTDLVPDPSAMIEVRSTDRGLLLPRVADTNAITLGGVAGLLIYSTSDNMVYLHNGKYWTLLCQSAPGNPGVVSGFKNCPGTASGTLTQGVAASGVSITLSYSGGNGQAYSAMEVPSTGVMGLTANLSASTLANGDGSLVYTITGVAAGSGVATFPISFGGQSCVIQVNVVPPAGTITGWPCPGAITGFQQSTYGGKFFYITYSASSGGVLPAKTLYNANGLTVSMNESTLYTTGGHLTVYIYGTPTTNGTISIPISVGGQTCNLQVIVNPAVPAGTITGWTCPGAITGFQQSTYRSVSFPISYRGSGGGVLPAKTLYNANGLTITMPATALSTTGGTLTFTVAGTPTISGTLSIPISVGGQVCTIQVSVIAAVLPTASNVYITGTFKASVPSPGFWVRPGSPVTCQCTLGPGASPSKTIYTWFTGRGGVTLPSGAGPSFKTIPAPNISPYGLGCKVTPVSESGVKGTTVNFTGPNLSVYPYN